MCKNGQKLLRGLLFIGSLGMWQVQAADRMPICAVEQGNTHAIRELIRAGANVDMRDEEAGDTPLLLAARRGNTAMVGCLIQCEAEVDIGNNRGFTPLMFAAELGHTKVV